VIFLDEHPAREEPTGQGSDGMALVEDCLLRFADRVGKVRGIAQKP
jgi:hypothetical protein